MGNVVSSSSLVQGVQPMSWLIEAAQKDGRTVLYLDYRGLTSVPLEVCALTHLTKLVLRGNDLSELPPSFAQLVSLKKLDLGRNQFQEFPDPVVKLFKLEKLVLSQNQLRKLPDSFGNLVNLKSLALGSGLEGTGTRRSFPPTPLVSLTDIKRDPTFWGGAVSVRGNQLNNLPDSFSNLANLLSLYLDFNKFKEFPEPLVKLTKLTVLDLGVNQLRKLPDSLGNLINLQAFGLSDNKFNKLPACIHNLESLFFLSIDGNPIKIKTLSSRDMTKLREVLQFDGLIGQTIDERRVKVLLIGEGGAGKSEMLRRVVGEEARGEHVQTRVAELSGVDIATVGAQAESWSRLESFSQSAFVADRRVANDLSDKEIRRLLKKKMKKPEGFMWHEEARRKWKKEEKKRRNEMMMTKEQTNLLSDDSNDNVGIAAGDNNNGGESVDLSDGKQKKAKNDAPAASSSSSSSSAQAQKNQTTTKEQESKKDHWILMVWDCGGQHVYHSAHKIFMNNHAVYCMVVRGPDLTEKSDKESIADEIRDFKGRASQDFAYWIVETVRPRASSAPVVVIVTHLDKWRESKKEVLQATKEAMQDSIGVKIDYGRQLLNDDFVIPTPFALDSWSTSDEATESIRAVGEKVLELGQILLENLSVPGEWLVMHDRLEMRREQWRKHPYRLPFISREELKDDLDKLLARDSTDKARDVGLLEEYLVRTGSLVRAPKSDDISDLYARAAAKNAKLDDKLFFDPHWLMEVLRAVIDDEVEEYSDSDSDLDSDADSDDEE